jgi:hypothetical protein
MPSIAYTKHKQRLALALCVEQSRSLAITCLYCRNQCRQCFLDLSESQHCSECIRAKRPCNAKPPVSLVPQQAVCHFFLQPRSSFLLKKVVTPPATPLWFPAFDPAWNFDLLELNALRFLWFLDPLASSVAEIVSFKVYPSFSKDT